jgi:drug/metabolite transporter (DMT)-like permease
VNAPVAIVVKLSLVALIWGGAFIAGRVAAAQMTAPTAALWRYLIATIALVALTFFREGGLPRLSRREWIGIVLLGATGVAAYNLCFMFGLESVPASRGSLIIALNPAATMIGAALFLHEPMTLGKVAGMLLALIGVTLELGGGNPLALFEGGAGVGEAALFGCVIAWAAYTLIGKRITVGISPLAVTTYAALVGTAMLVAIAFMRGELVVPNASPAGWASLAYMGILGTAVAFVWFLEGVKTLGPARAAIFVNLVPVAAITLGVLLLGERITLPMIAGAMLVIAGVWIINRPAQSMPSPAIAHPHI